MMMSLHGDTFARLSHGSSQKTSNSKLWRSLRCYFKQSVEETIEFPLIWDIITFLWRHCNEDNQCSHLKNITMHHLIYNLSDSKNDSPTTCPFGPLFNKRADVLPQDLVKSRGREIRVWNFSINLKSDWHLDSSAAEMPVKHQSDAVIITPNFAASRLWR